MKQPDIHLSNGRLLLNEIKRNDWKAIHAYSSRKEVSTYQTWGPNTEEETKAFVEKIIDDGLHQPRTRYVLAVRLKQNELLIGAGEINLRDTSNGEISYILHPDYWNQGIGTDVAHLLLTFGFQTFDLHRIYATCDPRNIGSAKVLEKIGMKQEGRMREVLKLEDGWRDSLLYSVLEQDFHKRNN